MPGIGGEATGSACLTVHCSGTFCGVLSQTGDPSGGGPHAINPGDLKDDDLKELMISRN
jgi:hypothetical protein